MDSNCLFKINLCLKKNLTCVAISCYSYWRPVQIPSRMSACKWLVSIFFPERSKTKVTIEIEHCVRLEDLFHSKKLQFISLVLESSDKCHFSLIEEEENFSQKGSMGCCTMFLKKNKPSYLELLCKTMATRKIIQFWETIKNNKIKPATLVVLDTVPLSIR